MTCATCVHGFDIPPANAEHDPLHVGDCHFCAIDAYADLSNKIDTLKASHRGDEKPAHEYHKSNVTCGVCRWIASLRVTPALDRLEIVAEECHRQWSGWTEYLLGKMSGEATPLGCRLSLDPVWAERWRRQIATPYALLTEDERESDRREARKILAALR